jgi:hypothetical protein
MQINCSSAVMMKFCFVFFISMLVIINVADSTDGTSFFGASPHSSLGASPLWSSSNEHKSSSYKDLFSESEMGLDKSSSYKDLFSESGMGLEPNKSGMSVICQPEPEPPTAGAEPPSNLPSHGAEPPSSAGTSSPSP